MKWSITYFYNVRFLNPNQVPISTAMFDPTWYHYGNNQSFTYTDKRGVINGLRCEALTPRFAAHICPCDKRHPEDCEFLISYAGWLDRFGEALINYIESIVTMHGGDEVVLLVHEKPDNPCSERKPLIEWLRKNNIECNELIVHHA